MIMEYRKIMKLLESAKGQQSKFEKKIELK